MARNVRRNLAEEVDHSGLLSTLSWIFNWRVPKISHPKPLDVALNTYSNYKTRPYLNRRRKNHYKNEKWSRRKRKNHVKSRRIQHRISSPYKFEEPLRYYDASQVYFYPSQH